MTTIITDEDGNVLGELLPLSEEYTNPPFTPYRIEFTCKDLPEDFTPHEGTNFRLTRDGIVIKGYILEVNGDKVIGLVTKDSGLK